MVCRLSFVVGGCDDEDVLREKVAWGPVPLHHQWAVRRRLARAARRAGQGRSRIARRRPVGSRP